MSKPFDIVDVDTLYRGVKDLKNFQLDRLYSTNHLTLDPLYKVYLGSCTDITGYPYSGKTLFLKDMLISLSKNHRLRNLIYLPDSGSNFEVGADLIHAVSGKTTQDGYPNTITPTELKYWFDWIIQHFIFIRPTSGKVKPIDFWKEACSMDVHTVSIDSWNYMDVDRDTKTLGDTISTRNIIAEQSGKHLFTIIHPRNPQGIDYDKEGKLKPPTAFNLMGGSEWNNNGKSIIVVHKESKESPNYDIYIRKTKPRIVGSSGFVTLQHDMVRQQFYTMPGDNRKIYAYEQQEPEQQSSIKPNKSFYGGKEDLIDDSIFDEPTDLPF